MKIKDGVSGKSETPSFFQDQTGIGSPAAQAQAQASDAMHRRSILSIV
ncbi:MAG: hypothetical protein Q8K62_06515 [Thiobacillus sp.]|nr:hypothetical protein [Thiobacillus sp.]